MPEIVTKYPEVLLKVLKDAGAQCGEGVPQKTLTSCPHDHFCSFPSGEICIYDFNDISSMTQISSSEWSQVISGVPGLYSSSNLIIMIIVFGVGLLIGMMLHKKTNKKV